MSENVSDEERLAPEIYFGDQPVFIPGNVEYHVGLHPVRTRKNLPEPGKFRPFTQSGANVAEPCGQRQVGNGAATTSAVERVAFYRSTASEPPSILCPPENP